MNIARWIRPEVAWSLLLLSMAACASGSQPAMSRGRDIDSLPRITIAATQRFGSEQSPDTGFSVVGEVDVNREGQVYAADQQDYRIRVYSPKGQLVRVIGQRGDGPGEFRSPPVFGIVGDTVWTYDRSNHRLTLFERNGKVISTAQVAQVEVPVPEVPSMKGVLGPVLMRPDGRFLSSIEGYLGGGPPQQGMPDTLRNPEVAWDASGHVVDTVAWYLAPHVPGQPAGYLTIGGQVYFVPSPPSDRPLRLLQPDGQIVVDRHVAADAAVDSISVTRTSFSGDTLYRRVYTYQPVGYSAAVVDSVVLKASRPGVERAGPGGGGEAATPAEVERAVRAKMAFPAYQPPVQDALLGASGSVWLRREDRGAETYEWVVLAPDGEARGVVDLPRTVHPAWARGDRVLTVRKDSTGVPWVVEYQLGGDQ